MGETVSLEHVLLCIQVICACIQWEIASQGKFASDLKQPCQLWLKMDGAWPIGTVVAFANRHNLKVIAFCRFPVVYHALCVLYMEAHVESLIVVAFAWLSPSILTFLFLPKQALNGRKNGRKTIEESGFDLARTTVCDCWRPSQLPELNFVPAIRSLLRGSCSLQHQ